MGGEQIMFFSGNCSCTHGRSKECQRSGGLVTLAGHWEGGGCHCRTRGSLGRRAGRWARGSPYQARSRYRSAWADCCGYIGRNCCRSASFWHSCNTCIILDSALRRMAGGSLRRLPSTKEPKAVAGFP